jgi:hypothetical protein
MSDNPDDEAAVNRTPTPPYGGFRPFWTFIEELRAQGEVPQVVDNTVLGANRSGAARSQLTVALRFFGLTSADRKPTERFAHLILGAEPEQQFAEMVREAYAPVLGIGLNSATPQQLDEALLALGSGSGETLRKTRLFFQSAAEMAGVELGPYLKKKGGGVSSRPRSSARRAKPKNGKTTSTVPTVVGDQAGMRYAVDLKSGGKVSVVVTVNLFELDPDDLTFVIGLVQSMKSYVGGELPDPE